MSDINETTRILATFLKPGGSLLIADFLKDSGTRPMDDTMLEPFKHVVAHKGGFAEAEMRATFEQAGLGNFECDVITQVTIPVIEVEADCFLAKGELVGQ